MFEELTDELLDLTATVRGHGAAVYAAVDDSTCSNGCSGIILCCTCTTLCW
jgi:hypothetical protein